VNAVIEPIFNLIYDETLKEKLPYQGSSQT
jgi:hypothetical protein